MSSHCIWNNHCVRIAVAAMKVSWGKQVPRGLNDRPAAGLLARVWAEREPDAPKRRGRRWKVAACTTSWAKEEQLSESPLANALRQFETAEANLAKLERLWAKAESLIPNGIVFGDDPEYETVCRSIDVILEHLPKIDGWKPDIDPPDLNALAQDRLDAGEIDEPEAIVAVESGISVPGRQLREYRFRFNQKRRALVRDRVRELEQTIDGVIPRIGEAIDDDARPNASVETEDWGLLRAAVTEIETLLGSSVERPPRWSDLRRHIGFALVCDFNDILKHDWPAVKAALEKSLYTEDEPIPTDVDDLGAIVSQKPRGQVPTQLNWKTLTDDEFERLVFSLIANEEGYENPEWLMRTNAPDRGRDLSVTRVTKDPLSGTARQRVIIQCKNWGEKSVSVPDIATLKEQVRLWDKPRVDVLIIATTGRFSADAVGSTETHNASDNALKLEMWPESHLERLLAARPALIAEFGLR